MSSTPLPVRPKEGGTAASPVVRFDNVWEEAYTKLKSEEPKLLQASPRGYSGGNSYEM